MQLHSRIVGRNIAISFTESDGGAVLFEATIDADGAANIIAALSARLAELAADASAGLGRHGAPSG